MNSKLILAIVLIFFTVASFAQGVRGTVVDETGDPLPNVSIYMPSERVGSTTNLEGEYEINLSPGEYDLVFTSLGFSRREFKLTIRATWLDLDVTLNPQSYHLREVVVNPGDEDPAYGIMRKAIGMAPYYLRQAASYSAGVYLKGSFRMDNIPRLLRKSITIETNGKEVPMVEGRTYTMESQNEITFIAPDTFNHKVLASRSSFPAGDESTAIGFISSSFYEPANGMIISPLAPQAMRHYKFRYEGYFEENNVEVNKIKVIPRRKSQQLVSGYVYIVQDLWNLHSVDVTSEMFFGDVRVKQVFQPVSENVWLPVLHQFDLDVSVMGVKAVADYTGSVKYNNVEIDDDLSVPGFLAVNTTEEDEAITEDDSPAEDISGSKNQTVIDELLSKEELSNREMMKLARLMDKESGKKEGPQSLEITSTYEMNVKSDSVKRDTAYWERIRPVPLTSIEQESFSMRDSLTRAAKAGTDTTNQKKEAGILKKTGNFLVRGHRFFMADSAVTVRYKGLLGLGNIGFNPVDGWNYKQSLEMWWKQESVHQMSVQADAFYGFAREALMWNVNLSQTYAPMQRGAFRLSAGEASSDFKNSEFAVKPFTDMVASLFFKENYKRYYNRRHLELGHGIDIVNGLRWDLSAGYQWLSPLNNNTSYSFLRKDEVYYENVPQNDDIGVDALGSRKSLTWRTELSYTPRHFYRIRKGRKMMAYSNYPTFFASMEQGVSALESNSDYLLLEGGVRHEKEADFFPALSWAAGGGWFVRNNKMHFSQYKHFNASKIPVRLTGRPAFNLIDDYAASTNDWYVDGHIKYSSPYLLLKNLPLLSNRLWQESLHLDYLHTPLIRNYLQAGYSIDGIFFMGSIGVFAGFEDGEYSDWGVRAVLEF